MIRFNNLTLGYGLRTLIDSLTGEVRYGELTALVGRNGTGKSTLLRAIAQLGEIHSGDIFLNGKPIGDISPAELSTLVAFVTTDKVRIANLRCRDVVALGRAPYTNWIGRMQQQDNEIVEQALASVGMSDYADKTMDRMSDGECQRIMIARALAQQTPIILMDEPSAFLDFPSKVELMLLLRNLAHNQGKAILLSTHDVGIALKTADMLWLMQDGGMTTGTPSELEASGDMDRFLGKSRAYI